ncbi:MAG: peptidoglycan DD-metalloendopeptidase family protein [Deltaproteobacteria bacterium]|jgi:murein DD-endopeptidase MepM/ murein hydrolase activator NlpD|nr:peptidoglycan DD-metalloendopeptidase family protein [Deltaproteobacteria bacterium]
MAKNRRLDERPGKAKIYWKRVFAAIGLVLALAFGVYQTGNLIVDPVADTQNLAASAISQTNPEITDTGLPASEEDQDESIPPLEVSPEEAALAAAGGEIAGDQPGVLPDAATGEPAEGSVDALADELADAEAAQELGTYRSVVDNGDTLGSLLEAWLSPAEIHSLADVCKGVYPLNRIRQGQPYAVHAEGENFLSFEYEIDNDNRLVIRKTDEGLTASKEEIEYRIVLHRVEGTIASSLFNAMQDSGEHVSLAAGLSDVFAWEINFIRDLREGDSFSLLVEKRYRDGDFKNYGRLLAATFTNQGDTYEAYLFTDEKGNNLYFNAEGDSLRRAFLKAPLAYNRISSGYTKRRLHPVYKDWRSHPAIDYAAPKGTPVKSVGKGTVTFKGYDKGAGNYIKVKHLNGYETMYLHLSGFARGLGKGSNVSQGQVIGFVGSTGYSTGPHLDFRMKRNGSYVNPLKELSPRDTPVTAKEKSRFLTQMAIYRDFLESRRNLAEYSRSLLN